MRPTSGHDRNLTFRLGPPKPLKNSTKCAIGANDKEK